MSSLSIHDENGTEFSDMLDYYENNFSGINDELDTTQSQYENLNSVFSSLCTEINKQREFHESDIMILKEKIAETKEKCESEYLSQLEIQKEELGRYSEQLLSEQKMSEMHASTTQNFQSGSLRGEIEKFQVYEAQIMEETQRNEEMLQKERMKMLIPPKIKRDFKSEIQNLENEISSLKQDISNSRVRNNELMNEISMSGDSGRLKHDTFRRRITKVFSQREKEYQRHLEIAEQMLEREKQYTEKEKEISKQTILAIKEAKERIKANLSKKAKDAIKEMRDASEIIDKDNENNEIMSVSLASTFSTAIQDKQSLELLKRQEEMLKEEIQDLKNRNKKAFDVLMYKENQEKDGDNSKYDVEEDF